MYRYFVSCNNCYNNASFGGVVDVENKVVDEKTLCELEQKTYDVSGADDYITIINFFLLQVGRTGNDDEPTTLCDDCNFVNDCEWHEKGIRAVECPNQTA